MPERPAFRGGRNVAMKPPPGKHTAAARFCRDLIARAEPDAD